MSPLAVRLVSCALCPLLVVLSVECGMLIAGRMARWDRERREAVSEAINPVLAELLEDGR